MVRRALVTLAAALLATTLSNASAAKQPSPEPPATTPPSPEPQPLTPEPPPTPAPPAPADTPPASAPIPAPRRAGEAVDEGGLYFGIGGGPALGLTSSTETGGVGVFEIGGGLGERTSPRGVLWQAGIGLPFAFLGRGDHAYVGGAFTLVNRLTWRRGPFEVGVRVAPGARFGSRSRAKDAPSATQLSVDASPEIFLRATRELWIGLGLDVLISAPTFEGSRGLPAIVGVPALKILLLPFN